MTFWCLLSESVVHADHKDDDLGALLTWLVLRNASESELN